MKSIILSGNVAKGRAALVDDKYYENLSKHCWSMSTTGYAVSKIKGEIVKMHWLILGKPERGYVTDHKNRNRIDNRESNLRICTKSQNGINTPPPITNKSGYKGVSFETKRGHWVVTIEKTLNGKRRGYKRRGFSTKEEAAIVYNKLARDLFGSMAFQNKVKT